MYYSETPGPGFYIDDMEPRRYRPGPGRFTPGIYLCYNPYNFYLLNLYEVSMVQFSSLLWTVLFGAIVVEAIVEIVRNIDERNTCWKYWLSVALGQIIGIVVAVNYRIDVFSLVGIEGKIPIIGAILTGIILSRGSNIVSDVIDRLNGDRPNA